MVIEWFRYIIRFVLLVLIQILVLNRINLYGIVSPYMYIMFILLLPFSTPPFVSMVTGLVLGLTIDKFSNTAGMHASACVLLAFIRPYLFNLLRPRDGYRPEDKPRLFIMGPLWFMIYVLLATFIHHICLFMLEAFTFTGFLVLLTKVGINGLLSAAMIYLTEALVGERRHK